MTDKKGDVITIDVKGIAKKYDWPAENIRRPKGNKHYIVLVSYEGQLEEPTFVPNVWVMPHGRIGYFIKQYGTRKNISRSLIKKRGARFLNAWHLIMKGANS